MILDQFDQDILAAKGKPEDILQEYYGIRVGANNARKYWTGITKHLKAKRKIADNGQANYLNERLVTGNGQITTRRMMILSESDSNDPYRIMQLNGFDPLQWELVSYKVKRNDWDTTMKLYEDDRAYPHRETNHQFKVELTVKVIQKIISTEYIEELFNRLDPPKLKEYKYKPGSMILELPIMDLHLGKLAWSKETGDDYDLKIAIELFKKTIVDLLEKLHHLRLPIEGILFPVGQDFFHVDNSVSTTTKGTVVDTDSRWQKMFGEGVDTLIWAIEELRKIAKVYITWVGGNHDQVLSYCAVYYISAYYRNTSNVEVDLSPMPRKYYHYGVNLIGWSHGKEGKRIEHLMQQEQPEAWGKTIFREWHLGDLHHEEAKEIGGVKIRRLSSLTALDAWHVQAGYHAIRMAQAFVWDKERGRQYVIDSNVRVIPEQ